MNEKWAVAGLAAAGCIAFCGYWWGWGPFAGLHDKKTATLLGNAPRYDLKKVPRLPNGPLTGKRVLFLGSSVTYGAASNGVSFADYIAARTGCIPVKEAVSGSTLADDAPDSYISRIKQIREKYFDLVICQLSTNDATQKKPLGKVTSVENTGFDAHTVAGALETILSYVRENWDCPAMIYTNCKYDSAAYAEMVALLPVFREKWGVGVIDLWSDEVFNALTEEQRALYMADSIHPTQAGYLEWWTPEMVRQMETFLKEEGQ